MFYGEDRHSGWGAGPQSTVGLHGSIKDGLWVFWAVSHKCAVISILQLKDLLCRDLGGCLEPLYIKQVLLVRLEKLVGGQCLEWVSN